MSSNGYAGAQSKSSPSDALKAMFAALPPLVTSYPLFRCPHNTIIFFYCIYHLFPSFSPRSVSPKYAALVLGGDFAQTRLALGKVPSPESVLRGPQVDTTMNTLSSPISIWLPQQQFPIHQTIKTSLSCLLAEKCPDSMLSPVLQSAYRSAFMATSNANLKDQGARKDRHSAPSGIPPSRLF